MSRAAQDPSWQRDESPNEPKNSIHGNAHNAERKQKQPHQRIENQRQKGQWPAEQKQDQPQQESKHVFSP
jgi:hypothetical protein